MKKTMIAAMAAMSALCIFAQDARPAPGPGGKGEGAPRQHRAPMAAMQGANAGTWVAAMLSKKENLEKLGLADAAARVKLQQKLEELREKSMKLERHIREISLEQSKMLRALLADRNGDAAALLAKIDEVAKLRSEQGRLAVESIVALRDALPPGKEAEALEMLAEFGKKMHSGFRRGGMERGGMERGGMKRGGMRPGERQNRRGGDNGERGRKPNGGNPPPDGETGNPPPDGETGNPPPDGEEV